MESASPAFQVSVSSSLECSQFTVLGPPSGGLTNIEQLGQTTAGLPHEHAENRQVVKHGLTKCARILAFNQRGLVVGIPCGQWGCTHCAKHLARMWAWRVKLHCQAHPEQQPYFWTLTLRGKYHTAEQGFKVLPRLWDAFRVSVQRQVHGVSWSYCAFVEGQPQRDYMPHFHIISMVKAPRRLKDMAMEAGFGYQASETAVTTAKAASYCAKYASKISPAVPKGFRRVRCSQDWAKLPVYEAAPLLVKSRDEFLWQFLWRVSEISGVSLEDLEVRWQDANETKLSESDRTGADFMRELIRMADESAARTQTKEKLP